MDVVQAVRPVSPGQERHLVAMFFLTFPTDLSQDELSTRVLCSREDAPGHLARQFPAEILSETATLMELLSLIHI